MLFLSPSLSELWDKRDQRGLKAWAEGDRPLTLTLGSHKNQQFQPLGMCSSGDPTASCFTWFPQNSRNPGDGQAHLASDQDLMGPLPLALQASPWGQPTMGCHLRKRSWRRSPGFPAVHSGLEGAGLFSLPARRSDYLSSSLTLRIFYSKQALGRHLLTGSELFWEIQHPALSPREGKRRTDN